MKIHLNYFGRSAIRFLIYFIISGFMLSAEASNHYVDKNASSGGNGSSWSTAWNSFSSINWSAVQPGDFVYISGGTDSTVYTEELTVGVSGTAGNLITITKGNRCRT